MLFPLPDKFPMSADPSYKGKTPTGRDVNKIASRGKDERISTPDEALPEDKEVVPGWLSTVNITLQWLKNAAYYAFHHVNPKGGRKNLHYWNKQEYYTYCRTCGFTNALAAAIEDAAKSGLPCPIPTRWKRERAFEKCHYAAMHMLFLGHVKSNMELFSAWLSLHELLTSFGKQVNPMLIIIWDMRMKRFHALPFSTSSWGTGPWVSENYVFWQRTWKYFMGYPIIWDNPKFRNPGVKSQLNVVKRFVACSHACISAIMTPSTENSSRMRQLVPIYLDTMVEMDKMTTAGKIAKSKKTNNNNNTVTKKGTRKRTPTYVKSNSLGILAVADAHDYFGSAAMNWEDGEEGERKIQEAKPHMGIRRKNALWQKTALQKIYTSDTIDWLMGRLPLSDKSEVTGRQSCLYHVYRDINTARYAISGDGALSIYEINGQLYILFRPVGEDDSTRSSYAFLGIEFDDINGKFHFGCWFSPLVESTKTNEIKVAHVSAMDGLITKAILALPLLESDPAGKHGYRRLNSFYLISEDWDERIGDGTFIKSHITHSLFTAWE